MITINKKIQITGGEAPYFYQWSTASSCLTFDKASGVIAGNVVETVFQFADVACNATTATLTVTANCGNTQTLTVNTSNPCNAMLISPISVTTTTQNKTFRVTAGGANCSNLQFTWSFDTAVWEQVSKVDSSSDSVLTLRPKQYVPGSTSISVVAKENCKGCTKSASYSYVFKPASAQDKVIYLFKDNLSSTGNYVSALTDFAFFAPDLDFATSEASLELPGGMVAVLNPLDSSKTKYVFSTADKTALQKGYYTMRDNFGGITNKASLSFIIVDTTGYSINLIPYSANIPCELTAGSVLDIPLEDGSRYVIDTGRSIDWSTFKIITPPTSASPSIVLSSTNGKRVIKYTVPTNLGVDAFSWTVSDDIGETARPVLYTIIKCVPKPVANNDALSMVAGSTTSFAVTLNDVFTGSALDPKTIQITSVDNGLTVTPTTDGKVTIVAASGISGTKVFKYTVKNLQGVTSNEATVTVTVINAGSDLSITLCN